MLFQQIEEPAEPHDSQVQETRILKRSDCHAKNILPKDCGKNRMKQQIPYKEKGWNYENILRKRNFGRTVGKSTSVYSTSKFSKKCFKCGVPVPPRMILSHATIHLKMTGVYYPKKCLLCHPEKYLSSVSYLKRHLKMIHEINYGNAVAGVHYLHQIKQWNALRKAEVNKCFKKQCVPNCTKTECVVCSH